MRVDLDAVRSLIVTGRADPQEPNALQAEQWELSVRACCALARVFALAGYDVAIDDVLEPDAVERAWAPALRGLDWRLVIVLPTLEETLARSRAREKRVQERHTRAQHAASSAWPDEYRIDTTGLDVAASLALAERVLSRPRPFAGEEEVRFP